MQAPPVLTAERIDAMLSIAAEVCLESVVEAGRRQKAAADDEAFERCGRSLQGACRNLRQTIAMKQRFDREEVQKAGEARKAAAEARQEAAQARKTAVAERRDLVRAHFIRVLWNEYEDDDAEELFEEELEPRLRDLTFGDAFLETPVEALIQRLADEIGLNDPEPDDESEPPPAQVSVAEAAPQEPSHPTDETLKPSPPTEPRAARAPSLRDPPPAGVDGEKVGGGGVDAEPDGPNPHPRSLPARGRGAEAEAPTPAISAVEPAGPPPDPHPPDPPPEPYIPPWERLRPGQIMPGGTGW